MSLETLSQAVATAALSGFDPTLRSSHLAIEFARSAQFESFTLGAA